MLKANSRLDNRGPPGAVAAAQAARPPAPARAPFRATHGVTRATFPYARPMRSGRRIGVFGGTFDPVHVGHLAAAANARHAAALDVVLMVVSNRPWQKVSSRCVTPAPERLALVGAAVQGLDWLQVSDIEVRRGGDSYTADTLVELAADHPQDELFLVVGADVAAELGTWERGVELRRLATLVVVNRPSVDVPAVDPRWRVVHAGMPAMDISSTDLRERVRDGRPLDFLVPPQAIRYIQQRGLYSDPR
ncbi:MAG: nicotinate-nucleotide adenylyltransferase [Actinomycetota bacterium]|nr:nicotinate-nucleotide adenylyltransferase [Actinomycetota bacterium]